MFDLGWTELLVIGIVALIVVGPKDLPILFRRVGQFVGKAKGMAREFSSAMNDAADDTGMRDISAGLNKSLKAATNPLGTAMDGVKSAASSLTDIDPNSETGKLAAQRAEDVKKIQAGTARAAAERKQREAAEALVKADAAEAALKPAVATKKAAPKKAAPKKPAVKKPAAKKAPAKKAPAKKPAAKKSST
jgi:sec-independent protein translocase protein TatB